MLPSRESLPDHQARFSRIPLVTGSSSLFVLAEELQVADRDQSGTRAFARPSEVEFRDLPPTFQANPGIVPGEWFAPDSSRCSESDRFGLGLSLVRHFVLFVIHLEARRIEIAGISSSPIGTWIRQSARNMIDREAGHLLGACPLVIRDPLFTNVLG